MNQYTGNSSKECVLQVDLEYCKELRELHNEYQLAPDKIELKREMLCEYQLKIADLISSLLVILKNWFITFMIKKCIWSIMKTYN